MVCREMLAFCCVQIGGGGVGDGAKTSLKFKEIFLIVIIAHTAGVGGWGGKVSSMSQA